MAIERIIAAVVDTRLLTLYREDGSTIEIKQGDPRVPALVDAVIPVVTAGGIAEINTDLYPNAYKEFEEKSSGLVKLFRVAKKAVTGLFSTEEVPPAEEGVFGLLPNQKINLAVAEIMQQAESVSAESFTERDTTDDETIIAAVVGDNGDLTVIPGVEALKEQFAYFAKLGSTKGMENFFKRLAPVMEKRSHSVEDLLRFLERGDLPIADDGCIIAYKILKYKDRSLDETIFVDPHTQKVTQRVGSYVCVDESLVDKNRRNECSNGLHIARRGYLGGFSGDLVTMCKIPPEDVITVPHNDANKVRVCGYHILFKLDDQAYSKLRSNRPATDIPGVSELLTRAITGKHPPAFETVRITQQRGGGLVITPTGKGTPPKQAAATVASPAPKKPDAVKHVALDDEKARPSSVDPKKVAAKVTETKAVGTRQQIVTDMVAKLYDTSLPRNERFNIGQDLIAFRKKAKVSWERLGQPSLSDDSITTLINNLPADKPKAPPKPKAGTKKKVTAKKTALKKSVVSTAPVGKETVAETALRLYVAKKWAELKAFKMAKKKSWSALGFSPKEEAIIMNALNPKK